jgi:hypothetical protein
MNKPIFIVGTGRCGSTMLSNMLRQHPYILSISELFSFVCDIGGRIPDLFPQEPIDGHRFWELISAITPRVSLALRHGVAMPEVLYPHDSPGARYSSETGVPAVLQVALPHLTDDHDALFDELREPVSSQPLAPIRAHYEHLFGWLQRRFGKRVWIERSGGAFVIIEPLYATFPDARFIHIVRDGRDTAISMREHVGFRLFLLMSMLTEMLGVDPHESTDRTNIDRVPPPLRAFLPESFDVDAFRDYRVPLALCGGLWSQQIGNGLNILGGLPTERVLTLRYEDFLTDAGTQLDRLAAFLDEEFVDKDWSARCAAGVRQPRSSWRALPEADARELTAACQPGFDLLRGAGIG